MLKIKITNLIVVFTTLLLSCQISYAYNIGKGDVLHLEVFGESELAIDVIVDSFGHIEYPFVGKLKVEGHQVEHVKNEVVKRLKDGYFINPQVTVVVKSSKPFFIQGEVNSPGSYTYEAGLTVAKAVALAGGLTERASKKKIYLTRSGDPSIQELKVGMDQLLESGDVIQIKESFF